MILERGRDIAGPSSHRPTHTQTKKTHVTYVQDWQPVVSLTHTFNYLSETTHMHRFKKLNAHNTVILFSKQIA